MLLTGIELEMIGQIAQKEGKLRLSEKKIRHYIQSLLYKI
jgi:hypothetical protein